MPWRAILRISINSNGRAMSSKTFQNLVAGEWVPGVGVSVDRNPSNVADVVGEFAQADAQQADAERPHLTKRRGSAAHSDLAVAVIAAIVGDRQDERIVNIPGQGMMPGFPAQTVVELVARIGADGAMPLPVPAPDAELTRLIGNVRLAEDLNVEAAMTGSVEKAVAAMAAHPLVGPGPARELTLELLAAHREYTPQFPH
jgi:6-phospho-beta-glucosidase